MVTLPMGSFAESLGASAAVDDTAMDSDGDTTRHAEDGTTTRHKSNENTRARAKRVTDDDGNTHTIKRVQHKDADGNVHTGTKVRHRDADGDLMGGRDRHVKRDADGNVLKGRERQGRVDADGNVIKRGRAGRVNPETGEVEKRKWNNGRDGDKPGVRDRMKMARDRAQNVHEKYKNARDRYQDTKEKFRNARERFNECKGDDSTECDDLRKDYRANAGRHLVQAADTLLGQLDRIQNYVESNVENEERLADMLAKIADARSQVEDAKAKAEALGDEPSSEDVKAVAAELRDAWSQVKDWTKKAKHHVVADKVGKLAQRLENAEEKFWNARDRLDDAGADVSSLDALLDEFGYILDDIADAEEGQRELFREAVSLAKEILREIHNLKNNVRGDGATPEPVAADAAEDV